MLEEQLDRNSSHPAVAPIYFPQELARLDSLQRDLEHFFGSNWRNSVIVPAATYRYEERLKKVSTERGAQLHISRGLLLDSVGIFPFFRLVRRAQSCWWPTPTLVTLVTYQEAKCWGKLPRNLSDSATKTDFPFSTSPAWPVPTASNSCTGAEWTASSCQTSKRRRCCRRQSTLSNSTSMWVKTGLKSWWCSAKFMSCCFSSHTESSERKQISKKMLCKHTTCWSFFNVLSPPGFWWLAENVEHHKGNGRADCGQRCQNFYVPIVTHHAVHGGTVRHTDHHWNWNVCLWALTSTLIKKKIYIYRTYQSTKCKWTKFNLCFVPQLKQWFFSCCYFYELLKKTKTNITPIHISSSYFSVEY